jgi:hypothetical protein
VIHLSHSHKKFLNYHERKKTMTGLHDIVGMLMVSTRTHTEKPVVLAVLLSHGYLVDSDSFYHALCRRNKFLSGLGHKTNR